MTDALFDHSTTSCGAMFNFEGTGNLEGATLLAGSQAFTAVSPGTTPHTYCGAGSLAIAATFSGTSGALEKGEVDIPLGVDGGSVDLSGKTLTVHVAASPAACGEDLRFTVILKTATRFAGGAQRQRPDVELHAPPRSRSSRSPAPAPPTRSRSKPSPTSGYTGTIYVDEIDIE